MEFLIIDVNIEWNIVLIRKYSSYLWLIETSKDQFVKHDTTNLDPSQL